MNTTHYFPRIFLQVALSFTVVTASFGQSVFQIEAKDMPLPERWKLATAEAGHRNFRDGYWIGYSIERLMGERSFIGSYYSERWRNRPTLSDLLTGMEHEAASPDVLDGDNLSVDGIMSFDENGRPRQKVMKEVAFLFHVEQSGREDVSDLRVSNMSLHVDLEKDPLIWIGSAGHGESVAFLISIYKGTETRDVRKHLMMAIGLQEDTKESLSFLKSVLRGPENSDVREDAAFWLGQTQSKEALSILAETAGSDRSDDVREKAIFAISQMQSDAATDVLIDLAKHHRDNEMRKKAAFWLGQKASEKAVGALKELAYKDEDTEVQKSALFALTQIERDDGVDELIKIANTHSNPRIRREAIFWLGQSESPKALQALIDIVKR